MKRAIGAAVLAIAWLPAMFAEGQTSAVDESRLRFAAAQHEIIAILIAEGQYQRAVEEFEKILDLGFSGPQEELVVRETWTVAKSLMDRGAYEQAHAVISAALKSLQSDESQFALLMLRGKVFKEQGKLREALEAYRQAQSFQQ